MYLAFRYALEKYRIFRHSEVRSTEESFIYKLKRYFGRYTPSV